MGPPYESKGWLMVGAIWWFLAAMLICAKLLGHGPDSWVFALFPLWGVGVILMISLTFYFVLMFFAWVLVKCGWRM